MLNSERRQSLIDLTRELIGIKSLSGEEGQLVQFLSRVMPDFSLDRVEVDRVGNITGTTLGQRPGQKILLDAHLDTVPAEGDGWLAPPFAPLTSKGKIFGRGASDMKGSLAAMLCAVSFFQADYGRDFAGEITVSGTVLEEFLEGVAAREVSSQLQPDLIIIGEATDLQVNIGQRGRVEIVIATRGQSAHSSSPKQGHNAVYDMMTLIRAIKDLERPIHSLLGKGILELTDIKSEPYPGASVVPSRCRASFDRRLLAGESREEVLEELQEVLSRQKGMQWEIKIPVLEKETWKGTTLQAEQFFPPWIMDENHFLVKKTRQGLARQGLETKIGNYSFCTNGSHYAGEAGIPTIGFGPSRENLAHIDNEYIEIGELEKGCRGYYGILQSLCGV